MNSKLIFACLLSSIIVCQARDPLPDLTNATFTADCLSKSTECRIKHQNTTALIYDILAGQLYAKLRCNYISRFNRLDNGHKGLVGYGETLFWSNSSAIKECSEAVEYWYAEGEDYIYTDQSYSEDTADFTQLVWKSTLFISCARCGAGTPNWFETYIVCNYFPPGNIASRFDENVLPLIE